MSVSADLSSEILDITADLEIVLRGEDGKSAYEVAVDNGFVGTEQEWLDSLKGEADRAEAYTQEAREYRDASQQNAIAAGNHATMAATYRNEAQEIKDSFAPEVAEATAAIQAEKAEAEFKKAEVDAAAEQANLDRVQADADAAEVRYLYQETIVHKNVATDAAERARLYADGAGDSATAAAESAQQAGESESHVEELHEEIMRVPVMTEEYTREAASSATSAAGSASSAAQSASEAEGYKSDTQALLLNLDTTVSNVNTLASEVSHNTEVAVQAADSASSNADIALQSAQTAVSSASTATSAAASAEASAETADLSAQAASASASTASTAAQTATSAATSAAASETAAANSAASAATSEAAATAARIDVDAALATKLGVNETAVNAAKVNNLTVETAVPAGAVFTDTTYEAMTASEAETGTATTSRVITAKVLADYVAGCIAALVASAPATLDTLQELATALGNDPNFATTMATALSNKLDVDAKAVSAGNADTVNNLTVETAVPANAVFTDTTYSEATTSVAGLMSASDKAKLNGIEPGASVPTLTGVKGDAESVYRTGDVNITKSNIGLGNVDNTADADKVVASAGIADAVSWSGVTNKPTTIAGYGITDAPTKTGSGASGTWDINISGNAATVNNLTVETAVPSGAKFTDTTYSNFVKSGSGAKAGLVPAPSTTAGTAKYLREDGTWQVPPDNNTTYTAASATPLANGTAAVGTSAKYAREDHVHPLQTSVSGSSGSCTGNAATATKLATARTINIQDSSATNTGTGASFDGSGNATIKLPATIKANVTGNCSGSSGSCTGNAATATKATQDKNGLQIDTGYLKLTGGTVKGGLNVGATGSGEGGEIHLQAADGANTQAGIVIDQNNSKMRVFGIASADGTTKKGTGTPLEIDPYGKTITGGYTFTGNVTGNVSGSSGSCTGNAATATKLATARTINIQDSSATNTGTGASFDGSGNATIKLPATIKASITGNCSGSSGSCTGNAATATKLATARTLWGASFDGSGNVSGNMSSVGSVTYSDTAANATRNLLYAKMGDNDYFRVLVGGASNAGYAEIATADDGNEPVYVRQYSGAFTTLTRTATLLDGSGNTTFPGKVTASGGFAGALTGNVTGNVSGSSGSCTGNAATATSAAACTGNSATASKAAQLTTARTIDGVSFNGTANITHYGSCSTAAATAEKAVACTGFTLATGARVAVKFTVTNTAANPTLNVNSTGAKAVYYRGAAIGAGYLAANRTYTFVYNGTQYELVGDLNTDTNNATAQNISTTNATYPILLGNTANATANIGNKAALFGKGVKVNPSTSEVIATKFTGALNGNANTATKINGKTIPVVSSFNSTTGVLALTSLS